EDWDLSLYIPLPEDDGDAFDDLTIACSIPLPVDEDDHLVEEDEDTLELALLTPLPADDESDWDLSLYIPLPEDDGDAFDDFAIACSIPLPADEVYDFVEEDLALALALLTPLPDDSENDLDLAHWIPLPEDDGDAFDEVSVALSTPLPEDKDDDFAEEGEDTLELALLTPLPDDGEDDFDLSLCIPLPDSDSSEELFVALSTPLLNDGDDEFIKEDDQDQDVGVSTLLEALVDNDEDVFIYVPSLDKHDGVEKPDTDSGNVISIPLPDDGEDDQKDAVEELAVVESSPVSVVPESPSVLKPVQEASSTEEPSDPPVIDDPFAFPPPETAQNGKLHAAARVFVPRQRATPLTPHPRTNHTVPEPLYKSECLSSPSQSTVPSTALPVASAQYLTPPRIQHPFPITPWVPITPTPIPNLQRPFAPPLVPMWEANPSVYPMGYIPAFPSPPRPPVFIPNPGYPTMPLVTCYHAYGSPGGLPSSPREAPPGPISRPESPPRPIPIIRPSASFEEADQMERDKEWRERIESRERERNEEWNNIQEERRLRHEQNEEWKRVRIEQRDTRRA
ncbi:hypothetical protein H0H93_011491, partial [Arthromyces matolae]